MFSPIIRSTWLYLQYLVVFTQVAAGWCHGWVETKLIYDTSQQQSGWILPEAVNAVKCSWWWAKTSHETCRWVCPEVSWRSFNSSKTPAGSNLGEYYQILSIQSSAPDDGRKHRLKHVDECVVRCLGGVSTHLQHQPAAIWVNTTRSCQYSQVLLMMGENIAWNM